VLLLCTLVELSKQTCLLASGNRRGSPLFSRSECNEL